MPRRLFELALLTVLTIPEPAFANGSFDLLVYALSLPGAVLFSYMSAMGAAIVKKSFLTRVFPSANNVSGPELLGPLNRQEWIASSIAYALTIMPGRDILRELLDARYTDPLLLPTLGLYLAIYIPIVYRANKSFGSVVGKEAWERLSRGNVAAYTLLLSLATPCLFIVMCGLCVSTLVVVAE